jgi:microcompartment protein CcmK/EutM
MYLAKVIGNVEAAMRLPGFEAKKFLLLQPIDFDQKPIRWVTIACDCTPGGGAGVGSIVAYVEGREAANPFENPPLPVDACVTAIVDSWEYKPANAAS